MISLIIKFYKAFKNSWYGFQSAWCYQWAFRVELGILLLAVPCAFYLGKNATEHALLISSVILLPMAELFNSAVETIIDRIGLEYHELSGRAKDLASAAMVVAGINILVTWGLILYERINALFLQAS